MRLGLLVPGQRHQADAERLVAARQFGAARDGLAQQGDRPVVVAAPPVDLGELPDQVDRWPGAVGEREREVQQQVGVFGAGEGEVSGAERLVVQVVARSGGVGGTGTSGLRAG